MKIGYGEGKTKYGSGVSIDLSGEDLASAIDLYIYSKGYYVEGARTITVKGELCEQANVYVDPSGFVIYNGERYDGSFKPSTINSLDLIERTIITGEGLYEIGSGHYIKIKYIEDPSVYQYEGCIDGVHYKWISSGKYYAYLEDEKWIAGSSEEYFVIEKLDEEVFYET